LRIEVERNPTDPAIGRVEADMAGYWAGRRLPATRLESHHGDRVVRCFAERPASVWAMFAAALASRPQAQALVAGDSRWTYAEAAQRIGAVAAGLAGRGIGSGDRVALLLSNRAEFYFAWFACQRLGAIAVPIGTREQRAGVDYVLGQCGAAAIIHDDAFAAQVPARSGVLRIGCPSPGTVPAAGAIPFAALATCSATAPAPAEVDEEDTATLLYTSGTTGKPKGAMLTHLGIIHSAMNLRACLELDAEVCSMLAVPASHVTGLVAIIVATVHCGGTVVMMPEFKAGAFLELADRERITYTVLVPAMYTLCLMQPDLDRHDLSSWRIGAYGGAPMAVATIDELARRPPGLRLANAYGATETTSPTTIMPPEATRGHADSVGRVVPNGAVAVLDDEGREVAPGETGELWIAGPMVVRGYWENPEADAREFSGGWWHSGDLGSVDAEGFVRVFDRKKDMINRGGYKIFSVEVENRLLAKPGVVEAAVIGAPCPVLGERVHAFVVSADAGLDEAALREWCAQALADYKVPETIRFRAEPLPRNPNGKLLKRLLRERLLAGSGDP
jgi:O-succinylbenzoic acid--CoA ligase